MQQWVRPPIPLLVTAVLLLLSLPVLAGGLLIAPALNSAICWENSIMNLSQSAGNHLSGIFGILRDYTPELMYYMMFSIPLVPCRPNYNEKFASYLAGLIEGDGSIITPLTERDNKGRMKYPSIQITFNAKDLPLALIIQKTLGCGSISKKKGSRAYTFTINNYQGLILVVKLINGLMRTPKINALYRLIDHLNAKGEKIKKLPLDNSPINSNGWLSGFIDAEGHFSIRASEAGKYPARVECKFELEQRQSDISGGNMFGILSKIADFLCSVVKETKVSTKTPQFRVRTTSVNANYILINYLTDYPLFSSKYLDYLVWSDVVKIFHKGEQKSQQGRDRIKQIKSTINDNRTIFIWDHLNNFYSLYE